jgi:hypothetical protein
MNELKNKSNLKYASSKANTMVVFTKSRSTMDNTRSTIIRDIVIRNHSEGTLLKFNEKIK